MSPLLGKEFFGLQSLVISSIHPIILCPCRQLLILFFRTPASQRPTPLTQPLIQYKNSGSSFDPRWPGEVVTCSLRVPDHTLAKERREGRIFGPFTHDEVFQKIGFFCSSPMGSVINGDSSFRVINNLSFPQGDEDTPSVNSFVDKNNFKTSDPSAPLAMEVFIHQRPRGTYVARYSCPIWRCCRLWNLWSTG